MKRKHIRGSARESESISHRKRISELNKVLANNIKNTIVGEIGFEPIVSY